MVLLVYIFSPEKSTTNGKWAQKCKTGWWFPKCLMFNPIWGNDPIWTYCIFFLNGLKPQTSFILTHQAHEFQPSGRWCSTCRHLWYEWVSHIVRGRRRHWVAIRPRTCHVNLWGYEKIAGKKKQGLDQSLNDFWNRSSIESLLKH